jgi:hypothetical protein
MTSLYTRAMNSTDPSQSPLPPRNPKDHDPQGCNIRPKLSCNSQCLIPVNSATSKFSIIWQLAWFNTFSLSFSSIFIASGPLKYRGYRTTNPSRGEALGGLSKINAKTCTLGTLADYDAWTVMGHSEWDYETVLPYFLKSKRTLNQHDSD